MTSIRRRTLFLLVPSTALALALVAAGVDVAVRRELERGFDRTLSTAARGLSGGLGVEIDGQVEFELEGRGPVEVEDPARAFFSVRRVHGPVIAASPGAPAGGFPRPSSDGPAFGTLRVDGRAYRVCTLPVVKAPEADEEDRARWAETHPGVPVPEVAPVAFWVTVGQRTDALEHTVEVVRARLAGGFALLLAALALIPVGVVSWALRPLRRLSEEARRLGPDDAGARLAEGGTDREVRALVVAFNRALDRLAEAYERQKRFSADAAHELRTPLTAIRTHCEVALRTPRDARALREAVRAVHRIALRMGALVENLLALTRLHNGLAGGREPADLARVAREAAQLNAAAARAKGVALAVDLPERIPVTGREDLLVECVSNLLDNAVRYTPKGGSVRVEGAAGPRPTLSVADTGIGIPEEHLEKIFERFYRADPARSREKGGTGLGLSLARDIARLHGGTLSVTSRPGQGSRFTLVLADGGRSGRPG